MDEDAKVINKTTSKIALTTSFLAFNLLTNIDDVSAKGHHNHSDHNNHVFKEGINGNTYNDQGGTTVHEKSALLNLDGEDKQVIDSIVGYPVNIESPAKSISSAHGNHYNHSNGGGRSS